MNTHTHARTHIQFRAQRLGGSGVSRQGCRRGGVRTGLTERQVEIAELAKRVESCAKGQDDDEQNQEEGARIEEHLRKHAHEGAQRPEAAQKAQQLDEDQEARQRGASAVGAHPVLAIPRQCEADDEPIAATNKREGRSVYGDDTVTGKKDRLEEGRMYQSMSIQFHPELK